jgi:hypothetical protein
MKYDFRKRYAAKRRNNCVDYLSIEMISNEKSLNYKVVYLDETFNSRIKFISIRVYTKRL